MKNFKLTICYDGSRYKGWQKLASTEDTIQARLEKLLSRLLVQEINVHGSGRTDSGVHARAQVCSFRANTDMPVDIMLSSLRKYLPEDIGAVSLEEVDSRFHARLSCTAKTYIYRIWNSDEPNVFERKYMYRFPQPIDDTAMKKAATYLLGKHDFRAFSSRSPGKKTTVREIYDIDIKRLGGEIRIIYRGDGFLYNMVRIMTGTLLEAGCGKIVPDDIPAILASGCRENSGFTAPAHGLVLWEVSYR